MKSILRISPKLVMLFILSMLLMASCRVDNESLRQVQLKSKLDLVLKKHSDMLELYASNDAGKSEIILKNYIDDIDQKSQDVDLVKICYWEKALALTRLEFVKAYLYSKPLDFTRAVEALAIANKTENIDGGSPERRRDTLIFLMRDEDKNKKMAWIDDEALKRAAEWKSEAQGKN